jgi:hypothetical protein
MRRVLLPLGWLLVATAAAASGQDVLPPVPALLEPTFLLTTPRIVDEDVADEHEIILGTTRELAIQDQSLTSPDQVFVPPVLSGRALGLGDVIQFYRLERRLSDPWSGEPLGRLMRPTGIGVVDSLAAETARVRLTHGFQPVLIGDFARPVEESDTLVTRTASPSAFAEGPMVGSPDDQAILPPFDTIFVRSGEREELAPGDVILLDRPGPEVDGRRLPDVPIARAMVVRVDGRLAAAVLIETFRSDLTPGDRFRREVPDGGT